MKYPKMNVQQQNIVICGETGMETIEEKDFLLKEAFISKFNSICFAGR
jgi:hypothetical protein